MLSTALKIHIIQNNVLNPLPHNPNFKRLLKKEPFENIVEKRENAGNQNFLLFSQCFLPFPQQSSMFVVLNC